MLRLFILLVVASFSSQLSAQNSIDWERFAQVAAIKGATVQELADKVTASYSTEKDKAAALYYWVTHNVAYDTKMLGKMLKGGMGPERLPVEEIARRKEEQVQYALQKGKGVCQNYARLYRSLCMAADLECVFISGHSRGNAMQPGTLGVGHAWNAVKVDEKWSLVDATWGAGSVNSKRKFNFRFKPGYFLPDPGSFSFSHLPKEEKWQLVEVPVSEEEFLAQPAIGPGFLSYGLHNLNYDTYRLALKRGKPLAITFTAKEAPGEILCVNMTAGKQIPCTATAEGNEYTITVPEKQVRNMVFNLRNRANEALVSYRLSVR